MGTQDRASRLINAATIEEIKSCGENGKLYQQEGDVAFVLCDDQRSADPFDDSFHGEATGAVEPFLSIFDYTLVHLLGGSVLFPDERILVRQK